MPAKKPQSEFLFGPVPHQEAIDFLGSKPIVSREVFDQLLPELKARAFTITGVESANVVQSIRDRLADLPKGESWETIKKDIADQLHPFLNNPEDPESRIGAERRAELLLRTHGFQAYQSAAYKVAERQADAFPFLQYISMEDDRVRPAHAALNGVVLPRDHEFWKTHFPPWGWGCRCQAVPITEDDHADLVKADAGKPKDQQNVLDDFAQKQLTEKRLLVRNGVSYNMTSPAEQKKPGAFYWHPGDLRLSLDDIKLRHDPQTFAEFEAFAKKQKLEGEVTVWDWLKGNELPPIVEPPTAVPLKPKKVKKPKVEKPAPIIVPPTIPATPPEWPDLSDLREVRGLGGSTGAKLMADSFGRQFVMKRGNSPQHLREEALTDELYRVLGLNVPKSKLIETESGPVKLAQFLEGKTLNALTGTARDEAMAKAREGFVADALLANWDVAGLGMDNLLVDGMGDVWRIDNGAGLRFRAQGATKTFGPKVGELDTLRDPKVNPSAAKLFGGLTDADIHRQIRGVLAKRADLEAALPIGLRDTMKRRLNDLESRLPVEPTKPQSAFQELAKEVKAARIVGKVSKRDRGDIEDTQVLFWEETGAVGSKITRAKMKLTPAGSAKIIERLRNSLPQPVVTAAQPADPYWPSILAGIKTVNSHATDGAYNTNTLAALETVKKQLAQLGNKEMASHYLAAISEIEKAKDAKVPTPMLAAYVPKAPTQAGPVAKEFKVERAKVGYEAKVSDRGHAREQGGTVYQHDALMIDLDGTKVKFVPFKDVNGSDYTAPFALRGYVEVLHPGEAGAESLEAITKKLDQLGIDMGETTDTYLEAMYLRKGMQIRTDVFTDTKLAAADSVLNDGTLDDAAKITKLKAMVKKELGLELPDAPTDGYDPRGKANAFGQGWSRTERWDLPRKHIEKEMKNYSLHHNTSRPLAEVVDSLLNGGGDFTSTTERLRKGVPISTGMSPDADLATGGANYLFTRIQTNAKAKAARGFNFKIGNLARQDAFTFDHDRFGRVNDASCYTARKKTVEEMKTASKKGGNETIFKYGIPLLDELDSIVAGSATERDALIATFKKHGYEKLTDGRNIADIILLTK